MQFGDLQEHHPERLYIVIEGVLANVVVDRTTRGRFIKTEDVQYHIMWYEVPLKRLIVTKERYPYEISLVTFINQDFADRAAIYLSLVEVPYDGIEYLDLDTFVSILPYQRMVRGVYDSDAERLDRYGVYGIGVTPGEDW
jgi:hypothetical protein